MAADPCHASPTRKERAAHIVRKVLGVKRLADWCGVGEAAVYQWLSRATEDEPFPLQRMPCVLRGAASEGIDFDRSELWPAMDGLFAPSPCADAAARVPEDVQ